MSNKNHRELFFKSDYAVGLGLASYAGLDKSVMSQYDTFEEVTEASDAMNELATSEKAYRQIVESDFALETQLNSENAMTSVASSTEAAAVIATNALDKLLENDVANEAFKSSESGSGKILVALSGFDTQNYDNIDQAVSDVDVRDVVFTTGSPRKYAESSPLVTYKLVAADSGIDPSNTGDSSNLFETDADANSVTSNNRSMDIIATVPPVLNAFLNSDHRVGQGVETQYGIVATGNDTFSAVMNDQTAAGVITESEVSESVKSDESLYIDLVTSTFGIEKSFTDAISTGDLLSSPYVVPELWEKNQPSTDLLKETQKSPPTTNYATTTGTIKKTVAANGDKSGNHVHLFNDGSVTVTGGNVLEILNYQNIALSEYDTLKFSVRYNTGSNDYRDEFRCNIAGNRVLTIRTKDISNSWTENQIDVSSFGDGSIEINHSHQTNREGGSRQEESRVLDARVRDVRLEQ